MNFKGCIKTFIMRMNRKNTSIGSHVFFKRRSAKKADKAGSFRKDWILSLCSIFRLNSDIIRMSESFDTNVSNINDPAVIIFRRILSTLSFRIKSIREHVLSEPCRFVYSSSLFRIRFTTGSPIL